MQRTKICTPFEYTAFKAARQPPPRVTYLDVPTAAPIGSEALPSIRKASTGKFGDPALGRSSMPVRRKFRHVEHRAADSGTDDRLGFQHE